MMARYGTSDLLLVYVGGHRKTYAFGKKTLELEPIGPSIAQSLGSVAFKWNVCIAVLCRRQDGQEYIQSSVINFDAPYKRETIETMLNEHHSQLAKTCNKEHIVNLGWIASTVPYEFDDEQTTKLFDKQNGWDYLAGWENKESK